MKLTSFSAPQRPIRTVLRQFTDWGRLLRIIFFFSFFSPFLHSGAVLSCVCWLSAATTTTEGKERQAANARATTEEKNETDGEERWDVKQLRRRRKTIQHSRAQNMLRLWGSGNFPLLWVLCEWKTYLKMRHVNTSRTVKGGWWCFHAQSSMCIALRQGYRVILGALFG